MDSGARRQTLASGIEVHQKMGGVVRSLSRLERMLSVHGRGHRVPVTLGVLSQPIGDAESAVV